ncbi:MAG: hypothetical protein C4308_04055 [Chitinophagaceae bacterium]
MSPLLKLLCFFSLIKLPAFCFAQPKEKLVVYFDFNRWDITTETATKLDSLLKAKGRIVTIELFGHCDKIGGYSYNDSLSIERALAVKNYLRKKGLLKLSLPL